MPVTVQKGNGDKPWKIVEKSTGHTVGASKTKSQAEASARLRNAITESGFKPKKQRRR